MGRLGILAIACVIISRTAFAASWQENLDEFLALSGHRNFIVVSDSAYPLHSGQGIRTIKVELPHLEILEHVITSVKRAQHVKGVIYLDRELDFVGEAYAPGIGSFRDQLKQLLSGQNVRILNHIEIIEKLDSVSKVFSVLVLKTDLTMPYTSVFIELDAGYWSSRAEADLRGRMCCASSQEQKHCIETCALQSD